MTTSAIWKGKIAAVVDDLRTDLDQLFLKAGQLGRRQRAQEVTEIVARGVKL
jgi:hypothetical protein